MKEQKKCVGVQRDGANRELGHFRVPKTNFNGDKFLSLCLKRACLSQILCSGIKCILGASVMQGSKCRIYHCLLDSKMYLIGQGWKRKKTKKTKQNRIKIENLQKPEVRMEFRNKINTDLDSTI